MSMNPEVIVTNIKKRFTGVSGTVNALLPVQSRSLKIEKAYVARAST